MYKVAKWSTTFIAVILFLGVSGCGTNVQDILYQTGSSVGRSFYDMLLTEMVNDIADAFDTTADDAADDEDADDDGEDPADDGADDDADDDGDDGAAPDGATLYADNCAACHGDDGASGFGPDVTGLSADDMAAGLESGTHAGISLTDDEVAAIAELMGG